MRKWRIVTIIFLCYAKSLQSCPTLCDPIDGSPPGSPVPGILQGKNTGVGCHFLLQCMKVKSESEVAQSCPTLSDPMDCSPPGSSVHGIFQARVLEWGAIAFSDNFSIAKFNSHDELFWNCVLFKVIFIFIYLFLEIIYLFGCNGSSLLRQLSLGWLA